MGDPLGRASGRPDAPEVQVVGQRALDEVDERVVRRPAEEVTVETGGGGEDLARLRRLAGVAHEHRIAGPGRVVDETGAVAGPVELGDALQVGPWLSAEERYREDADVRADSSRHALAPRRSRGSRPVRTPASGSTG